jgi:hypothetical protein
MAKQQLAEAANKQQQQLTTEEKEEEALARQFSGAGISNKAADNIVPQIKIMQPLSPEIVDGKLPNAKPGDFLIGSSIIPGAEGFWFQPCHWDQLWLEFQPLQSGGGFVASHPWLGDVRGRPNLPAEARAIDDFHYKIGDNELIHYRQWAGLAWIDKHPLERTINFKSTGHTIARNWNNAAREAHRFHDGTVRPLFAHIYKLTTERISNAKGTWYQLKVGEPVLLSNRVQQAKDIVGDDTLSVVKLGAELYKAFAAGDLQAEVEAEPVKQTIEDEIPF